ncbi:MAG: amidohydrolase [Firmicutes bacterium]|nr:amidohydrolase [Bacillota bacterium]
MIKLEDIQGMKDFLLKTRRWIHMHPETGFDTVKTHDFIRDELKRKNIEVIEHVGKNSLLGIIENGQGKTIGLRADIDALPMTEQNTVEYASINIGKMHACGHDAHSAMLLTAGIYLQEHKDLWSGKVILIFQEAEEGPNPGGALGIIESGLLNQVEHFYAFHVSSMFESGKIVSKKQGIFASADTIKITLKGKGAHAAYPHLAIDPIMMSAEIIMLLQTILSRRKNPLDPAVLTIAKIESGTTHNIIPETAYLEGTVRTFSYELRDWIKNEIEAVLKSVTSRVGGTYDYQYIYEYDPTINTDVEVDLFHKVVTETLGEDTYIELKQPSMGAEDFSRYIEYKQGAMAWLGTKKDDATAYSLHHPLFQLDEEALMKGAMTFVNLVVAHKEG